MGALRRRPGRATVAVESHDRLDLPTFVQRWKDSALTERAAAQSHFIDLCRLLGQPAPTDDPDDQEYAFEKRVAKATGGKGWADVWRRGCFAWEYKAPGADLRKAYFQLLQYREELANPPLLVVSDFRRFEIHTNFPDTLKRVYSFTLADLLANQKSVYGLTPLQVLRWLFTEPDQLSPGTSTVEVTEDAAAEFAGLAESMRRRGVAPEPAARFLIRLLFCLFAEDIGLFRDPKKPQRERPLVFTDLVNGTRWYPEAFASELSRLFEAMAHSGWFGGRRIPHFNGGLFDDAAVIALTSEELAILASACDRDWASIEPSVFGVLFERGLDPAKRAALGLHYTSRVDIERIVEPVVMAPLRRRWAEVQAQAIPIIAERDAARVGPRTRERRATVTRCQGRLQALLTGFMDELGKIRVLDPAAGSGNFLYVTLKLLLDLGKEVSQFGALNYLTHMMPTVRPEQLSGIEIDPYAHQLASAVVWIGYLQWLHDNGFGIPKEPYLHLLQTVERRDAIAACDAEGRLVEPEWPAADVIIGNPPFLGDKKMRSELGDQYVDELRRLYAGRVPGGADLVCYWFERAREQIVAGKTRRVGLLATNSIRQTQNRRVVARIKETGDIFMAWSDQPWVLDGAAVRVSCLGFDGGMETVRTLDGVPVVSISADLKADLDLTQARRLRENARIAFIGDTKKGKFDLPETAAKAMLAAPLNPNGRPNSDVLRPYANAYDITQGSRGMWIIDFGIDMSQEVAALYEQPFAHVQRHVKPERDEVRNAQERSRWWLHARPAADFRAAVEPLSRYIVTPNVSKHRVFVWLKGPALPAHKLIAIARDDEYFLGMLQSRTHEIWSLRLGSWQGVGNDPVYTPTTTFETFPFPWPPGQEPAGDARVEAIAAAAGELVRRRDAWLNPSDASEEVLKKRTLTNLYNERPTWLEMAHAALDRAVLDAYGWPHDLSDEQILERLLALNLERAGVSGGDVP